MRKIAFFIYILLGILVLSTTSLAAESNFAGGTYCWDWMQIEQIYLVKEGQGGYGLEIWPRTNFMPEGELKKAPLKYLGGHEVIEIAALLASPNKIKCVSYETSKAVAYWGTPSYISGGKKIPMYRISGFFFHRQTDKPEEKKKSGEVIKGKVIKGGLQVPGWCCADGQVFRASWHECKERRGIAHSSDRNKVLQYCEEKPPEPGRLAPYRGEPRHEGDPDEPRHEGDRGDATPITLP